MCFHIFLLLSTCIFMVAGQRNITLDDDDPRITYRPPRSWFVSENSTLDHGYAHTLTQTPNATATFNFTGVAIYFLSPLWPYHVTTALSLDFGPITLLDLVDRSHPDTGGFGPETVHADVVWSAIGLNNTQHTLLIFVGERQPFAIVDGLIYTVLEESDGDGGNATASIQQSSFTLSSTPSSLPTSGPAPPATDPETRRRTQIAVGTVLGCLGLLIILLFIWFCVRRRRRPLSEAWTFASNPRPSTMPPVVNPRPQAMYLDPSEFPPPVSFRTTSKPCEKDAGGHLHVVPSPLGSSSTSSYDVVDRSSTVQRPNETATHSTETNTSSTMYIHGATLSTIIENSPFTDPTASLPQTPASELRGGTFPSGGSSADRTPTLAQGPPDHAVLASPQPSLRRISGQVRRN